MFNHGRLGAGFGRIANVPPFGSTPPRWRPNVQDIPGLKAWYDPTDPTQMSLDGNNGIEMFIPHIPTPPAPFVMEQLVEANRPLIGNFNGKNWIHCPDGNRWLSKDAAPLPDRDVGLAQVIVWGATGPITGTSVCQINRLAPPAQRVDILIEPGTQSFLYRYGTFGGDFGQASRPIPLSYPVAITTTLGQLHWLNGGDIGSFGTGSLSPSPDANLELGHFAGLVGHWIIVSGPTVTVEQLRKLEGFVAWDLGIEALLVPGHPWRDQAP